MRAATIRPLSHVAGAWSILFGRGRWFTQRELHGSGEEQANQFALAINIGFAEDTFELRAQGILAHIQFFRRFLDADA